MSGVNAIDPLVAFYDIHGGKTEVLFFYTTRDYTHKNVNIVNNLLGPKLEMIAQF
jgi:hypothetical protein